MNLNRLTAILADAGATPNTVPNPTGETIKLMLLLGFGFVMVYVMGIRPQARKAKEQANMLSTMKPGDKVVTSGGVVGTVLTVRRRRFQSVPRTPSWKCLSRPLRILPSAAASRVRVNPERLHHESK